MSDDKLALRILLYLSKRSGILDEDVTTNTIMSELPYDSKLMRRELNWLVSRGFVGGTWEKGVDEDTWRITVKGERYLKVNSLWNENGDEIDFDKEA